MKTLTKRITVFGLLCFITAATHAADRLDEQPGYERYTFVRENLSKLVTGGTLSKLKWSEDGKELLYTRGEQRYCLDLMTGTITEYEQTEEEKKEADESNPRRRLRGRQRDIEPSPDGNWNARSADWNVVLERTEELGGRIVGTTEGTRNHRLAQVRCVYGVAPRPHHRMLS